MKARIFFLILLGVTVQVAGCNENHAKKQQKLAQFRTENQQQITLKRQELMAIRKKLKEVYLVLTDEQLAKVEAFQSSIENQKPKTTQAETAWAMHLALPENVTNQLFDLWIEEEEIKERIRTLTAIDEIVISTMNGHVQVPAGEI